MAPHHRAYGPIRKATPAGHGGLARTVCVALLVELAALYIGTAFADDYVTVPTHPRTSPDTRCLNGDMCESVGDACGSRQMRWYCTCEGGVYGIPMRDPYGRWNCSRI